MKSIENHIKNTIENRNIFPKDDLWNEIEGKIDTKVSNQPSNRKYLWFGIAASLLFLFVSVYFIKINSNENQDIVKQTNNVKSNIKKTSLQNNIKRKDSLYSNSQNKLYTQLEKNATNEELEVNKKIKNLSKNILTENKNNVSQTTKSTKDNESFVLNKNQIVVEPNPNPAIEIANIEKQVKTENKQSIVKRKYTNSDALLYSVENEEQIKLTKKTFTEKAVAYVEEKLK